MKVGFVIPWIQRTGGNKTVLSVAEGLARGGHDVQLFCHTVRTDLVPEIERQIGGATFSYAVRSERSYEGHRDDLSWQLPSRRYRRLAETILAAHRGAPFDAVIVVANEGRQLGRQLRHALPRPQPLFGWSIMELIDHSFLLSRERDLPWLRSLLSPVYPAAHWAWGRSMRDFDFLCANSEWTSDLVGYLYGLECGHILVSLPEEAFGPGPGSGDLPPGPYIAVPTVSLGPREQGLLAEVASQGLNLVSFGPRPAPGVPHLGYLSEERLREVLRGAAATLFLFDYEALGLIPFESLAVGTPVVTLPKYGVHVQWRESPYVEFAGTARGLAEACRRRLLGPPTVADRESARASVDRFRASRAAASLVSYLEEVRSVKEALDGASAGREHALDSAKGAD